MAECCSLDPVEHVPRQNDVVFSQTRAPTRFNLRPQMVKATLFCTKLVLQATPKSPT